MRYLTLLCAVFLSTTVQATSAQEKLSVLAPFIGTWTSVSGSVDSSENFQDVAKWEWAFGGNVVRIIHSVNKGDYAGESLIHWDDVQGKIIYRYVNTASFYTDGTITPQADGSIEVHEYVRGSKDGPTESLSGYRVDQGRIVAWSKFKTNGKWAEPSQVTYDRTPGAEIVIKPPRLP